MPAIALSFKPCTAAGSIAVRRVEIALTAADKIAQPEDLKRMEWPAGLDGSVPILLDGPAPNWVMAFLAQRCFHLGAPWVACYEPRLHAAIIVGSRMSDLLPGAVLTLHAGNQTATVEDKGELVLHVSALPDRSGAVYQCLVCDIHGRLPPLCLQKLALPDDLDLTHPVVLWGAAPVWLYARLAILCAAAPWVGCYNIREGSVVVAASRDQRTHPGDSFHLVSRPPAPAILIAGPPNSGKSVLCANLDLRLRERLGECVHLYRAHPDGEGDWFSEMYVRPEYRALADQLRKRAKGRYSDRFFFYHAGAVSNARETARLVLVDFGGMPKASDVALLHRCTHYIIISSRPEAVDEWHEFCARRGGLQCLAVIHSTLNMREQVEQTEPYLEMVAGPWERGSSILPEALLQAVLALVSEIPSNSSSLRS